MRTQYASWKATRFTLARAPSTTVGEPSDRSAVQTPLLSRPSLRPSSESMQYTYYLPDATRDSHADILQATRRIQPISSKRMYEMWAVCSSQRSPSIQYSLTVHPTGAATCSCPDWLSRGGACKHLRAFRAIIQRAMASGQLTLDYHFPSSLEEAQEIEAKNRVWYGSQYTEAISASAGDTSAAMSVNFGCVLPPSTAEHLLPSITHDIELDEAIDNLVYQECMESKNPAVEPAGTTTPAISDPILEVC